jgi:hydrogenase maturation protease
MKPRPAVRLLVCGNAHRRDDGAAPFAVGQLLPRLRRGRCVVEVTRCGQLDVQHLLDVPAGEPVVLVDAAVGVPAGEVIVRPLDELIDFPNGPSPHSSHALPASLVLGMANAIAEQPLSGVFVGIGGADFGYGDTLSPKVREQLPAYVDAIVEAIVRLAVHSAVVGPGRVH